MERRGFLAALLAVAAAPRQALAKVLAPKWSWKTYTAGFTVTSSRPELLALWRKIQPPLTEAVQFSYEEWHLDTANLDVDRRPLEVDWGEGVASIPEEDHAT